MPEELRPDSLTDATLDRPGADEALAEARAFRGRDVIDANGDLVGRVTACFAEGGKLVECDVTLSEQLRRTHGTERHVARISCEDVARVEGDRLRLRVAAAQVVPDARLPGEPSGRAQGADRFPRKTR